MKKLERPRGYRIGGKRRRGAMLVLVLVAAMIVVILGMVAFAVDIGSIVTNRTQFQSAADAAALAGASTLVENASLTKSKNEALKFAQINAPSSHASVTLGKWEPTTKMFVPDSVSPHAVRVVVERTQERGNAAPSFFAAVFGRKHFDIRAEAIAVGATSTNVTDSFVQTLSVYVTSTKDLSNVVLHFADGTHQKFEGLSGYSGNFAGTGVHAGKEIVGVWIKSGCYMSGDGPGYGEYIANPDTNATVHGKVANEGCNARVTATFGATGVVFSESGSDSPVRLVH